MKIPMPRHPVSGLLELAVGGTAAGVVTLMLGWAAVALLEPEVALDWATAITERMSNLRGAAAEEWGRQYLSPGFCGTLILLAFIPYWFARQGLAMAYTDLLPLGVSQDGLMRVDFDEPPCVGGFARGRIMLGHKPRPGETFGVKLSCQRREPPAIQGPDRTEFEIVEVHVQTREAAPELEAGQWAIHFEFDVPASVPHTPHGLERLSLLGPTRGPATWVVQATDASGDHEIEFDMGRARIDRPVGVAA